MKNEDLFRAMGAVGDDLLERSEDALCCAAHPLRTLLWRLLAACICVAVLGAILFAAWPQNGAVTAQSITEYEGAPLLGGETTTYLTKSGSSVADVLYSPVQSSEQAAALPVYTPRITANPEAYAQEKAAEWTDALQRVFGETPGQVEIRNYGDDRVFMRSFGSVCGPAAAHLTIDGSGGCMQLRYRLNDFENGSPLAAALPVDAQNRELIQAAGPVLGAMSGLTGRDFAVGRVERSIDSMDGTVWVYLHAWEPSGDPAQELYNIYLDEARVTFHQEDGKLVLSSAAYTYSELERAFSGDTELLTLDAAEEELEKGWCFVGHVCEICMARQDGVDFSQYDGVEIVYRDAPICTHVIPYYSFCKQLDQNRYAVTYVPAVHVEGLAEYFEAQKAVHESNVQQ